MTEEVSRWEHGSDLHWPWPLEGRRGFFPTEHRLFGSGRDALRALFVHCGARHGARRFHLPTYLCQEVVAALAGDGAELRLYPDAPDEGGARLGELQVGPGDLVVLVDYFGLRGDLPAVKLRERGAVVVEDRSHDPFGPFAERSAADYVVASLRKTLPLPDGAIVFSPAGHELPRAERVTPERARASFARFSGMCLKGLYLAGYQVTKPLFRELLLEGERAIAAGPVSGASQLAQGLLGTFPLAAWREARRRNFSRAHELLRELREVRVHDSRRPECVPFMVWLEFSDARLRERVRQGLLSRRVYPAVLWPLDEPVLEGVRERDADLARRSLWLHCDARYSIGDMERMAREVRAALEEALG